MVSIISNSIYYQSFLCPHFNIFQILICIPNNSIKHQLLVYTKLNDQKVLFQTIQFSVYSSIWLIDRTLSGATTFVQSGPWSNRHEGVLCISQSSSVTKASPSDYSVMHKILIGEAYLCAEMQSVYSATQADWAKRIQHYIYIYIYIYIYKICKRIVCMKLYF